MPIHILSRQLASRCRRFVPFFDQLPHTSHLSPSRNSVTSSFRINDICSAPVFATGKSHDLLLRTICYSRFVTAAKKSEKPYSASSFEPEDVCQVFDQSEKLIGQMKIKEAENLARKEHLRLVSMGENPDGLNSFRLMTGRDLAQEVKRQRLEKKAERVKEKEFRLKSNITDHDLEIKLRQAKEIIAKGDHVKVVIKAHKRTPEGDTDRVLTQLMKKVTGQLKDAAHIKHGIKNPTELQLLLRPVPSASADQEK